MNLLVIPFHDWRKIILEGSRTRDAHFIEELDKNNSILKVIINRPTTLLEILLKRKPNLIKGTVIYSKNNFKLYKLKENLYLVDFISYDVIGQILKGYSWFIEQYGNQKYIDFINDALLKLGIENNYNLLNQNVFAYGLSVKLKPKKSIFDAWDNFTKFNVYSKIKSNIVEGYKVLGDVCDLWITNSKDNIEVFNNEFSPKSIYLIANGVDVCRFVEDDSSEIPKDLEKIPKPIVGFGGKITQLIDVGLLNETMKITPKTSFVIVGQLLDKQVYDKIHKLDNFYYLGDKHYNDYPKYVKNFDICVVPYVVEEGEKSGANSIKVYEYLAANKKVIGTNSNGLEDLSAHLYIVKNPKEFSKEIMNGMNDKKKIDLDTHSWVGKTEELIKLLDI